MRKWSDAKLFAHETIEGFLHSIDVSAATANTYREALESFAHWLGPKRKIDRLTLRAYKEWLKAHRAANTAATYLAALRRFFQYALFEGLLSYNPLEGVKGVRRPRGHLRQDLSREEIRAVLKEIDRRTELGKRDFAMINLMVRNGLRVVEIQRANAGDLETRQGRKILRVLGKGRDTRDEFVVLAEPTVQALQDYLACRRKLRPHDPLFAGVGGSNTHKRLTTRQVNRRVNYYLKKAGVKTRKISPHSLRHSFVTLAIQSGASLIEAQIAARHRSIETTRVYFHEHDRLEAPIEDKIKI